MTNFSEKHQTELTIAIGLLGYITVYLLNIYFTNHLSTTSYGQLSVILQAVTLFSIIGLFGSEQVILRYLPRYIATGKRRSASAVFHWSITLASILSMGLFFIGAILVIIIFVLDYLHIVHILDWHPFFYSFWLIPLMVFPKLFAFTLEADKQSILSELTLNFLGTLFQLILMTTLGIFVFQLGLYQILIMIGISQVIVILIQYIQIKTTVTKKLNVKNPKYDRKKEWAGFSFKMLFNDFLDFLYGSVNLFMFAILTPVKSEVGIFAALLLYRGIIQAIGDAISVTRCWQIDEASDDPKKLQNIANTSNIQQFIFTLPVPLAAIFFGREILDFFSPEYTAGTQPLILITICYFISSLTDTCDDILVYAGFEEMEIYNMVFILAFFVIADLIFIPIYGLWGVAIILSVGNILAAIWAVVAVRWKLGIKGLTFV